MQTLSKGFKKPEDGDKGSVFFDALEGNIQQLNDHTHDGNDSAAIPSTNITKITSSIVSGSWAAVAGKTGLYKQTVTLPGSLTFGTIGILMSDTDTGHFYNLTIEKVTSTTYDVFINDNTKNLTALYV